MGKRLSTVEAHPQIARINSMLEDGVSYSVIARKFSLSVPAVGRHALSRRNVLEQYEVNRPNLATVALRLLDAADHAQEVRRHSRIAGTPVGQSRAIRDETDVLVKLVDKLGIDGTDLPEFIESSVAMGKAVIDHVQHDSTVDDLISRLQADPAVADIGNALRRQRDEKR
jgi:hypothetical protein